MVFFFFHWAWHAINGIKVSTQVPPYYDIGAFSFFVRFPPGVIFWIANCFVFPPTTSISFLSPVFDSVFQAFFELIFVC